MSDNMSRLYLKFSGNKHKFILNVNLARLTGMFFTVPAVIPRDTFKLNPVYSIQTAWTLPQFRSEPEAHSIRQKISVDIKEKFTSHQTSSVPQILGDENLQKNLEFRILQIQKDDTSITFSSQDYRKIQVGKDLRRFVIQPLPQTIVILRLMKVLRAYPFGV